MAELQLDAKKTALVLIDLQNAIVGMNPVPHTAAQVVENSRKLAEAFRARGAPVVYVRVDLNDLMTLPVDQPHNRGDKPLPAAASEIAPSAGFQPGDILVTKRHWGAFADTDLGQQLKSRGIDTVVLTGISTNAGVESTAR
jgi:nicotinamidase-related amidase